MGDARFSPALACFAAGITGVGIAELGVRSTWAWGVLLLVATCVVGMAVRGRCGTALACTFVCASGLGLRAARVEAPALPAPCGARPMSGDARPMSGDARPMSGDARPMSGDESPEQGGASAASADALRSGGTTPLASGAAARADGVAPPALGRRFLATVDAPIGREVSESGRVRLRVVLRVQSEACEGVWAARDSRLLAYLDDDGTALGLGDLFDVAMEVQAWPPRRGLAQTDPVSRARRQGLAGTARVRAFAPVREAQGVSAALERWRQRTAQRFEALLPRETQALGKALAVGDQAAIGRAQRQAWADAGTAHLLSVSGLHVALVAWLMLVLARALVHRLPLVGEMWGSERAAVALTVPGVIAYGLVTGGSPAAWRATLMACGLLVARSVHRDMRVGDALGLAGLALLCVTPMAVYDPGFWLSFVAVGALLAVPRPKPEQGLLRRAWSALRAGLLVSATASLVTAPLTAWYFGRISLMGPITNLVAAPLGSWVATPLALLLAIGGPWFAPLAHVSAWALHHVLRGLDILAWRAAAMPFAAFDVNLPRLDWFASSWPGFGLSRESWPSFGLSWESWRNFGLSWESWRGFGLPWGRAAKGLLIVQHLYVGHGDATFVRLPQGETMLVDGGGAVGEAADPGEWAVIPALRAAGVQRIDVMVATHPHPDHINGLAAVARRFAVREFWYNGTGAGLAAMGELVEALRTHGTLIRTAASLPGRTMLGGVEIERLHPSPPLQGVRSANDNSLVLRLQYGARSMLLTGDIEAWGESQVADVLRPVDIMKVPHHGSRTSSGCTLLRAAQPQLAIASCGADNRWGFPHAEVRARYDAASVPLWRTDTHGEITARTDGTRWHVKSIATGEEMTLGTQSAALPWRCMP